MTQTRKKHCVAVKTKGARTALMEGATVAALSSRFGVQARRFHA